MPAERGVLMGKIEQMMQGRNEGLRFALDIVKQGGQEALEDEIRKRHLQGVSLNVPANEIKAADREITERVMERVCAAALLTLHDEFGFGQQRCLRFLHRFEGKMEAMTEASTDVDNEDYKQAVLDELKIQLTGPKKLAD